MQEWVIREDVPILDEHVLRDEDGNPTVTIDARKLRLIADKNNKRIEQTGDWTPIVVGHTDDDAPEDGQPEIVGYAGKFRVKPLFQTGKQAIHARFMFMADKIHKARKFPRRSVELWLSDWKIDPIALLGATTPERDLGLLQLSRGGRSYMTRAFYSADMNLGTGSMPPDQGATGAAGPQAPLVQELLAALQQTDVFQWVKQKMEEEQAEQMQPPMDPMGGMDGPPAAPVAPDQGLGDDEYDDYDDNEPEEEEDEQPVRRSAVGTPAMPSATNTSPPRSLRQMSRSPRHPGVSPALTPLDRVRLSQASQQIRYAKQERVIAQLAQEHEKLLIERDRERREKDLIQLEAEGVLFDRAKELEDAESLELTDAGWKNQVDKMRLHYSRAPVGRVRFSAHEARSADPGSPKNQMTREKMQQVAEYAQKNGVTFEAALDKLAS